MTRMETRAERLNRAYAKSYTPKFNPLISNLDRPDFGRFMGDATEEERAEMNKRETYATYPKPPKSFAPIWLAVGVLVLLAMSVSVVLGLRWVVGL